MLRHKLVGLALYISFGSVGMILAQAAQFLEAPQYCTLPATGNVCPIANPQAVATGDFNGDGNLDLAVANSTGNTVSVLLGNGAGGFTFAADYAVGSTPKGIAVGQTRGSGQPYDLIVTNSLGNTVSILLGNGDGSFQAQTLYNTGTKPMGVAVGNFSTSGNLDLVVTNSDDNTVGVLLGNGDGTFQTMVTYRSGFNPTSVAVGDFTGSGVLDLAVANNNTNNVLSILMGNGDGTFQGQTQVATGNTPIWVALGDFNGDGYLDIAVADEEGNTVSILLGKGNGGFQTHVDYPTALFPTAVAVADFDGNGTLDLAVSSGNGNTVSVLWGNGDGTFSAQDNLGTGDIPYSVITGDFNNDGKTDLVVANSGGNSLSVILNDGGQAFQAREDYPAGGTEPYSIVAADLNGNGILDLAVAISNCPVFPNCGPGGVAIMVGNGDGTFQTPTSLLSTGTNTDPDSLAVGDFNGDGIPDLAVANYATGTVSVLLGNGGTPPTFQGHIDSPVGSEPAALAVGDFNGDGKLDLAVANFHDNTVSVLLGNGNGTFTAAPSSPYTVGHGPVSIAVGDFTGSGILDLVVINETDNNATVLLGNGTGSFPNQSNYPIVAGGNPLSVAVGDFTGSGVLDLAVADYQKQEVSILLGNGSGGFGTATQFSTGANPSSVVIADFNGDGIPDLALTSTPLGTAPGNEVSILLGNPQIPGAFLPYTLYGTGSQAYSAAVGAFSNDGTADVAVANGISNTVSVLLNTQGTHISVVASVNPSNYGQSVTFTTTVTPSLTGMPAPTGTVTLKNGTTVLGSGTLVSGSFSASTSALPAGTDTISASYSGDSNFQPHTVSVTQTVLPGPASTTTALNASSNLPSLTLTATVSSVAPGTPTGTVTFMDGTTQLGSPMPLNGSGVATLSSVTSLPAGTQNITAIYSGDTNFTGSTSSAVPVNAGFALTDVALSPGSVQPGGSATSTITIAPTNGFNPSLVTFTCAVTGGGTPAPTCSVGAITGSGTAPVTVSTTANTQRLAALFTDRRPGALLAFGLLIPALLLGAGGLSKQQRQKMLVCCLAVLVLGGCLFQAACGGGSSSTSTPPPSGGTPAGTYTISVTGASGSVTGVQAPALTLTVQ